MLELVPDKSFRTIVPTVFPVGMLTSWHILSILLDILIVPFYAMKTCEMKLK